MYIHFFYTWNTRYTHFFTCSIGFSLTFLCRVQPRRDCPWNLHISPLGTVTVVNVAEKVTVLVQDMDALVVTICCQDPTLTVCSDVPRFKWFLFSRRSTGVSKTELARCVDHHNCTGGKVSHADI